jgi:opacity protein-like surface antigen
MPFLKGNAMKKVWIHLPLWIVLGSSAAHAGDFKRFEFQPFGGYTFSGNIPLTGEDDVKYGSVHVNNSYNAGATFAVNLNELDAVEVLWQRQFTEGRLKVEIAVPNPPEDLAAFNLKIDQYHCNFLHHYRIADSRAMPYVMAGLGATTYYADGNGQSGSASFFSFSVGGGMKYFVTRHFGFRGEARWTPTLLSSSDSSLWCSIGGLGAICVTGIKGSAQNQMDVTGGIVIRF